MKHGSRPSSRSRSGRRLLVWIVTVCLLAVVPLVSPNFRARPADSVDPFAGDFLQEWIGGYIVLQGDLRRLYDTNYATQLEHDAELVGFQWHGDRYFPMVYPPFYYGLVSPLAWLPLPVATRVWFGLLGLTYLASWALLRRVLPEGPLLDWLLPVGLFFAPLLESLTSCQKGTLLLGLLSATYYFLVRGRPFWAGVVFGLVAFKPQLALPFALLMLWKREGRFVLGGALTGSVLVGICMVMGLDVCGQYIEFGRRASAYLHTSGYDLAKAVTWQAFWTQLLGRIGMERAVAALVIISTVVTLGVLLWSWRGPLAFSSAKFGRQYTQMLLATFLMSLHTFTYDLTVLLLPLALLVSEVRQGTAPRAHQWLGITLFALVGLTPMLATKTGVQLATVLMGLWLVILTVPSQRWTKSPSV